MLQSQGDWLNAITEGSASDSGRVAEIGVARYLDMIHNNRFISTYPHCSQANWDASTEVCTDSGSEESWAYAHNIPGVCDQNNTTDVVNNADYVSAKSQLKDGNGNKLWYNINPNDPDQGQYRLVSYDYEPTTPTNTYGDPPGKGTLIVEGRVNPGSENESVRRVRVTIPVDDNLGLNAPAVWIHDPLGNVRSFGTEKIQGDIVVFSEDCSIPTGTGQPTTANLSDANVYSLSASATPMPETPPLPPSNFYYTLTETEVWNETFPRAGENNYLDGFYHYLVPTLQNPEIETGETIADIDIFPGEKVIFHLQSKIKLDTPVEMNKSVISQPPNFRIYGNDFTDSSHTASVYGCPPGTSVFNGNDCTTATIKMNVDETIVAFIHAPNSYATFNTSTGVDGNFWGVVWVLEWQAQAGSPQIKVRSGGPGLTFFTAFGFPAMSFFRYSTYAKENETLKTTPQLSRILELQVEEVN